MRIESHSNSITRRRFLRDMAVGTGTVVASATLLSMAGCDGDRQAQGSARIPQVGEKLRIGLVGVGGRGKSNLDGILGTDESVAAICDTDATKLDEAGKKIGDRFPKARRYRDYREMFQTESDLQAVVISTPDHMHAPIGMTALARGMHVYCEKPLTRTVWEARRMNELASAAGIATQMGNQGSASGDMRHGIEIIQAGLLGTIREVHAWTNRPIWPQGIARPDGSDPVPDTLFWDGWLGVAPKRPFKADVYTPFKWRGWYDFGAGAFGDMGCHTLNMPFRALHLADPHRGRGGHDLGPHAGDLPACLDGAFRLRAPSQSAGSDPVVVRWRHQATVRAHPRSGEGAWSVGWKRLGAGGRRRGPVQRR